MSTGPRLVIWRYLSLLKLSREFSSAFLPLLALLFACQSPDDTVGPGANDEPATQSTHPSADQVLALATPPGLRWYRSHTHQVASGAPAAHPQLMSLSLAASISQPTDLGTSFPSNTASLAVAINASGQLSGWTVPAEGPAVIKAIRWEEDGTPVELPKATQEGQAIASDVNDAGVVVGSDNELHEEFGWSSHAMRWNPDGSFLELPLVPGARNQLAVAINKDGVVVGWAELVTLDIQAVRWDHQGAHVLPGNHGAASDVNDAGTTVGYVEVPGLRPAIWSPAGTLTVLSLPDGDTFGFATGINNLGQVVGAAGVSNGPDLTHHAVIWEPDGTPTVIPNSEMGEGSKINDAGVVVGYIEDVSPELPGQTGAIWIEGERVFAPPSPTARTVLNDLNETQLAGGFYPTELHAARWSFTSSGTHFDFTGFFPPVRNPGSTAPYVMNRVRAGQAVPIKFSLNGNKGLNVLADGSPRSKAVPCALTDTQGGQAANTAGRTGLSYQPGADQYSYIWKTEKAWAGTCRQLMVGLTDGSVHTALFKFPQ